MKKSIFCFSIILLFSLVNPAAALDIKVGDRFHITGCEKGELMVPVVNMWNKPGGAIKGAKVIGKLSGDGREDQGLKCQGAIVELLEIKNVDDRIFLKVKSVVNSKVGWITDSFVGRKTKKGK